MTVFRLLIMNVKLASYDMARELQLLAEADLGMGGLCGRTGAPQKGGPT